MIPSKVEKEVNMLFGATTSFAIVSKGGLSRAIVYRVETPAARYALKRWPVTLERERLKDLHRLQEHLAHSERPLTPVLVKWSHGTTFLEAGGTHWEIAAWMPGDPIQKTGEINDQQICHCAQSLADQHLRSESLGEQVEVPPGLKQRYELMISSIQPPNDRRIRFVESVRNHKNYLSAEVIKDIHLRAMRVISLSIDSMKRLAETPMPCFWILRDVWRQNILFRENQVSGILDFGAARVDWPGLDLVRAFGTLMVESDPRWPLALSHYLERRPDDSLVLANLQTVHRASVSLSALQWLDWFAEGHYDWTDLTPQVWKRLLELQLQLEDSERNSSAG